MPGRRAEHGRRSPERPTCTIRRYLDACGKVVWYSDIPFYYSSRCPAARTRRGATTGSINVLGFAGSSATRDVVGAVVTITDACKRWGLKTPWTSTRPTGAGPSRPISRSWRPMGQRGGLRLGQALCTGRHLPRVRPDRGPHGGPGRHRQPDRGRGVLRGVHDGLGADPRRRRDRHSS